MRQPLITTPDVESEIAAYEARHSRSPEGRNTGAFYTPSEIAAYLVSRTLGERLQHTTLQRIQQWQVIDPACGTGIFLLEALKILAAFYKDHALENPAALALEQLHGIDIDACALQLTRQRLEEAAFKIDGKAPQKSIDLQEENALESVGQWDFVLGNPPYLSEVRKQAILFRTLKNSPYYRAKMDLSDAFLHWALDHLKPDGHLAYVLPAYWMQRTSSAPLRKQLMGAGQIQEIWTFEDTPLFRHAPGHHSSLLQWKKTPGTGADLHHGKDLPLHASRLQPAQILLQSDARLLLGTPREMDCLESLGKAPPLFQAAQIQQGVVMPLGRLKTADRLATGHAAGFLLSEEELSPWPLTDAETAALVPYFRPAGFAAFSGFAGRNPDYQLIYADSVFRHHIALYPEQYPHLKTHLDAVAAVNTSAFAPYGLHRPRQPEWFEAAGRILCPRQVSRPAFAMVDSIVYVNEGFYILQPENPADAPWMTALLNSDLAWFWFYHHKRKGHQLQIDKDVLCTFPAPTQLTPDLQEKLRQLHDQWVLAGEPESVLSLYQKLNGLTAQAYGLQNFDWQSPGLRGVV